MAGTRQTSEGDGASNNFDIKRVQKHQQPTATVPVKSLNTPSHSLERQSVSKHLTGTVYDEGS